MTEADKPIVSIIMAVYNGSAWIEQAIRSVVNQSYPRVELLVINDGSTDNTEDVVLRLTQSDSRIRYFKQENKGVSAARNVGLRMMQGSFFAFLDADDCLTAGSISSRMLKFEQDNSLCFCDGGVTVFDHSMKFPRRHWRPRTNGFVFKKLVALSDACFFGPTWLIKRDPSRNYSFQEDMTHAEDLFFFMEIARSGKYDYVDEDILRYRTSHTSAMRNLKGLANGYISVFAKVRERFGIDITLRDLLFLWIRIRIIMTLSFIGDRHFLSAFLFLITGRSK